MKAAIINEYGSSDVIEIAQDWPDPVVSDGKVVVKVHAASINPIDYKIRAGYLKAFMPIQFPKILCLDVAGVITEVGDGVVDLKVGDEVYGQANFFEGGGSMAEQTTANATSLAPKPSNTSFPEAAALPLTAISAYQALVDNMNLKAGQKLLIHGGAGGIGSIAIQLGKHIGAYVATTVTSKDIDFVNSLGVDQVIDYKSQDFAEVISDFDGVLDLIGGDVYVNSFKVLKPQGVIVSLAEQPNSELSEKYNVNARYQSTQVNNEALLKVAALVEEDAIKPIVEKTFSLDQAKEAFAFSESEHPRGKVVVEVN